MGDPIETGGLVLTGAAGMKIAEKLGSLFLGRHFKKQDDTDTKLDLVLEAVRKVQSEQTLAHQRLNDRLDSLEKSVAEKFGNVTTELATMKTDATRAEGRSNKALADHKRQLANHRDRLVVMQTVLAMRGLMTPVPLDAGEPEESA